MKKHLEVSPTQPSRRLERSTEEEKLQRTTCMSGSRGINEHAAKSPSQAKMGQIAVSLRKQIAEDEWGTD